MNHSGLKDMECYWSATGSEGNTSNSSNCTIYNGNLLQTILKEDIPTVSTGAQKFFTFFTPLIFTIGIVGNLLSLVVFMSKNMRKLSASIYLAALSTSDLMALVFYVLPEWLKHGLTDLPGQQSAIFLQHQGSCQIMLYLQYISRFLSSFFLVLFTIERFIAVCFPLHRKMLCNPRSAAKVILGFIFFAAVGCLFKPILSRSYTALNGDPLCTSDKTFRYLSFVLDSVFAVTITFIPFVLITVLNLLIIRRLVIRNKRHRKIRLVTEESIIRLEFTFILLAISICFVSFNLPYFAVWCKRYFVKKHTFTLSHSDVSSMTIHGIDNQLGKLDEILHITRTIFYINYCINFFLYSVTGAYFRKELKHLLPLHRKCSLQSQRQSSPHHFRSHDHSMRKTWV